MKRALIYLKITSAAALCCTVCVVSPLPAEQFTAWEMMKDDAIARYIGKDVKHEDFRFEKDPKYDNRILNYILPIDTGIRSRICIVRTRTSPQRDYLFVNNRLYSVMETYGTLPRKRLDELVKKLSEEFGQPQIQQDRTMTVHTYTGAATKVLLFSSDRGGGFESKVYYYSSNLFKRLIAE